MGAGLSACGRETPPLAGAKIGGPFTLTDQDGRRVSDSQFAGRYRLVYFGYTYCPDVCPLDVQNLALGLKQLEESDPGKAEKIQPIFISIDPARDTPEVLKQFVSAFHPRLIGLTGTEAEIATVAKEFAVYYKKQPPAPDTSGYLVDHLRQAMLFGPKGEPLALIPQEEGAEPIAAELARWTK
nr:SCO family protein [Sphingomonas oleivorans]